MEKQVLEFLLNANKLKKIKRSGWVKKVGVKNPESVADHCFGTALSCMLLSSIKRLNTEKVLKMALLHDLAETKMGDLTPEKKKTIKFSEIEEKTMNDIISSLPEEIRSEYIDLWREFKDQTSEEAKLVKDLDLIEMGIQALDYEMEGYEKEKLDEFWKTIERNISGETRKIFEALKDMR